jgi:hypothetical protein
MGFSILLRVSLQDFQQFRSLFRVALAGIRFDGFTEVSERLGVGILTEIRIRSFGGIQTRDAPAEISYRLLK